jgi:hypothetical protein
MNLSDTVELINALKSKGVLHFKSHDFEVSFKPSGVETHVGSEQSMQVVTPAPEGPIDPVATQKAQDLIDILKLKDDALVDKIFPDGAQ